MSLTAASEQRKERLAQLQQGAKRKRDNLGSAPVSSETSVSTNVMQYRNYDPESQAPKLGFLHNPAQADVETTESRANILQADTLRNTTHPDTDEIRYEAQDLRANGANWDLKREVLSKLEQLKPQQDAIIAKYVREKIMRSKDLKIQ